jgi:hypothetical protein
VILTGWLLIKCQYSECLNARNFFQKWLLPGSENFIDMDDETLFVVIIILVLLLLSNVDSATRNLDFC